MAMERRHVLVILVIILLLSAFLRFYRLDSQSFWNDEGNSARLSERSIKLIVKGAASDIHPPLYYLILHGWREIVGDSEFALRSFSVFLGVGVVVLTFALGRQLLDWAGWVAAAAGAIFAAINPALIYYSQEVRMYELLAFLAVLSTWLLIRLLQRPGWPTGLAIAYILVSAAGLYTHYFFPAVLLIHNMIFLLWLLNSLNQARVSGSGEGIFKPEHKQAGARKNSIPQWVKDVIVWLTIMLAILALYLPWLPIFLRQSGGRSVPRISPTSFLVESNKWMAFGPTIELEEVIIPLLGYTILFLTGLFFGWKLKRRGIFYSLTLLFGLVIPVVVMWLIGATKPEFLKFLLVAVPPLCLIAGSGSWWAWNKMESSNLKRLLRIIVAFSLAFVVLGTGRSLYNMYFDSQYARADYRGMVARIVAEGHPNAAIVVNAANQWEVVTYYYSDSELVFPIPAGYPDPAVIDDELRQITTEFERIYVIFWAEAERDPNRLVERWLDENAFKARDEWVGDVRFVTYSIPAEIPAGIGTRLDFPVGEVIKLIGFTSSDARLVPGDIYQLSLFWQAEEKMDKRYKVFLHLVDQEGRIVSQRDSEPGGGLALTTTWQPGTLVTDNHGLYIPLDTPPGEYTLYIGLYDIADASQRLSILADDSLVDVLPIAQITVVQE